MTINQLYSEFLKSTGVSTDTRSIEKNNIYFALKGDNFDGNKFINQAFENGAKLCVIDDPYLKTTPNCIYVANVLNSLQQLATHHRQQINIPIISLTGSNGKTTTKELIYNVLASSYKVKGTKGNLNNHIGVALTLLSFTKDLDFGIVEMGANHQKEIEFLSHLALPDYGLITNFGKAHLEGFGSVDGVIKGKSELYDFLRTHKKTIFVNTNDTKQLQQIREYKTIVTFGEDAANQCKVNFVSAAPFVKLKYQNLEIQSHLIGDYNFANIAVAIAIGQYFSISPLKIKKAIESYIPNNNRSQIIEKNGNTILLDAYNANPTSMISALTNFKKLKYNRKVLILGDMFELGDAAEIEHQNIVDFVESNFESDAIYLVGKHFFGTKTTSSTNTYKNFNAFAETIKIKPFNNRFILVKGSRGMALERLLNFI